MTAVGRTSAATTLSGGQSLDWDAAGLDLAGFIRITPYVQRITFADTEGFVYATEPAGNRWQGYRRTYSDSSPNTVAVNIVFLRLAMTQYPPLPKPQETTSSLRQSGNALRLLPYCYYWGKLLCGHGDLREACLFAMSKKMADRPNEDKKPHRPRRKRRVGNASHSSGGL